MKFKIFLVAIFACLLLPCLASCGGDKDVFGDYANRGYTCRVTYDLGGGEVDGKDSIIYLVKPDSLIPELGVTRTNPMTTEPYLSGYLIEGYYVKDGNGNERRWDFATDRVTGDITIYTKWKKEYSIDVRYGDDLSQSYSVTLSADSLTMTSIRQMDWSGHTFYGFYTDPEFRNPVTFPYTAPVSDEQPTVTLYARYLEGKYTIIRTAADFGKSIKAGTNYYLDADIDLTGISMTVADSYTGQFIGNGHTIRGLSVTRRQTRNSQSYGLFGTLGRTARFENVTFEDLKVYVVLDNEMNTLISHIGFLAGSVGSDVTFENVTVNGTLGYNCCGRDLSQILEIGDGNGNYLVGEADGVDTSTLHGTVTVEEIPHNGEPE